VIIAGVTARVSRFHERIVETAGRVTERTRA